MQRDMDYYLSLGFEPEVAAYYVAGRKRLQKVEAGTDKTLRLYFDNGERRRLDCKEMIAADAAFAFLREDAAFDRVYLDEDRCVAWDRNPEVNSEKDWNNKVTLCPDRCYIDSVPLDQ